MYCLLTAPLHPCIKEKLRFPTWTFGPLDRSLKQWIRQCFTENVFPDYLMNYIYFHLGIIPNVTNTGYTAPRSYRKSCALQFRFVALALANVGPMKRQSCNSRRGRFVPSQHDWRGVDIPAMPSAFGTSSWALLFVHVNRGDRLG